jgi:D-galactarolactone cycloisomerase
VHLSAAAANSLLIELKALPNPMQHELTSTPLVAAGGRLEVPNRPGLGVAIDEAAVARYVDSR